MALRILALLLLSTSAHADCWPLPDLSTTRIGAIPATSSTRYSHYILYDCLTSTSAYTKVWLTSPGEMAQTAVANIRSHAVADAYLSTHQPIPATELEKAYIYQLQVAFGVKAYVTGAATTTRPTYPLNADGTRGTTTTGKRVYGQTQCNEGTRVKDTSYYSMEGKQATDGTVLGKVVAICSLVSITGVNKTP